MVEQIELWADSHGVVIKLADAQYDWWTFWLVGAESERQFLGAESLRVLGPRLATALRGPTGEVAGQFNGQDVEWVLSLAEAHHSLYAAYGESNLMLLWQDAATDIIAIMTLSESQRQAWLATLAAKNVAGEG